MLLRYEVRETMMKALSVLDAQARNKGFSQLSDEVLETILIIARDGQSGRITAHEIRTLVAGYRANNKREAD